MTFEKDEKNLIIKLPLLQEGNDTYGDGKWKAQNFVIVKTWDKKLDDWDYTISGANYLDYKDDLQESMPIIHLSEKEFNELLKLGFILFTEHPKCDKCKEPIYGCFALDGEGNNICMSCNKK
jgi:hypothetical protein